MFDEEPDADPHGECAAEIHRLTEEVELRRKQLMLITNFPGHPGGHEMDASSEAECPEDWREGWISAVHAMQAVVLAECS